MKDTRSEQAYRDTFWNRQRLKKHMKIKDVAKELNYTTGITNMFFTGQRMPTHEVAELICILFDVDFDEGYNEFYRANQSWKANHEKRKSLVPKKEKTVRRLIKKPIIPVPKPVVTQADNVGDRVMEMLYNKISYTDFKILTGQIMSGADILECVYGKVDYDTFATIRNIVKA